MEHLGNPAINDLMAIEDAIVVADLLTKTRDRGLPWIKVAPDFYTLTICEPPDCRLPAVPSDSWTFNVAKNQANDGALSYVYYLDALLDDEPYFSIDSRQTNYVEQLFRTIELVSVPVCELRIDNAIDFISGIPTSPSSPVTDFVMCGGVDVGGSALVHVDYWPYIEPAGASVAGNTPYVLIFVPPIMPYGAEPGGTAEPVTVSFSLVPQGGGTAAGGGVVGAVYDGKLLATAQSTITAQPA